MLTTHRSLASKYFMDTIKNVNCKTFLIVDEVHGIGSKKQRCALLENYDYRLGLSATPYRWFDEEGTNIILNYFGGVVYEFNIQRALEEINPLTGKSYLTPYEYHPIIVDLNDEEIEKYTILSIKIAQILSSDKKNKKDLSEPLCNQRQNIINNAEAKFNAFRKILREHNDIKDLIVYCSPQQINRVQQILMDEDVTPQHKFTQNEKVTKSQNYGGLTQREYIIKNFEKGSYKALVAIKCLDEGVDIPSARNAIILSSTSNTRVHVQRRGRILRRFKGKDLSIIYDVLVFPNDGTELTSKIIEKEIKRYREFAKTAKNSGECLKILEKYYGV